MSGTIHAGAWEGREYIGHEEDLLLIEPLASAFYQLQANFRGSDNVTMVKAALGASEGVAEMHLSEPDYSSSILAPKKHLEMFPDIAFGGETEFVKLTTLDKVMREDGGSYDKLVIDVQGYELEVLKGATETLKGIKQIVCEVNTDETYEGCARLEQVDAFLADYGFKRTVIDLWADAHGDALYVK